MSLPPIEGTISAKPFGCVHTGRVSAPVTTPRNGSISGQVGDAQSSAVAELGGLINSLGSLSAQAQNLPLSAPTLPGLPQSNGYQPQPTDYTQFSDDSN